MKNYHSLKGYIVAFFIVMGIFSLIVLFQYDSSDPEVLFTTHSSESLGFPFVFFETGSMTFYVEALLGDILVLALTSFLLGAIINRRLPKSDL